MKRPRSVASRTVGLDEYKSALRTWRHSHHEQSFHAILGPSLVQDLRGVQPSHVLQLMVLFQELINHGCSNCMLLPAKFEQALKEVFASDGCAGKQLGLDLYAHQVGKHIYTCFSMLRVWALDQVRPSVANKSNSFKKRCSTAELAIFSQLISKLDITGCTPDHSPAPSASVHLPLPCPSVNASSTPPCSLPDCFRRYLHNTKGAALSRTSSVASSRASTVLYDEDGIPALPPLQDFQPEESPKSSAVDAGLQSELLKPKDTSNPLLPRSKPRKAAVGPPQTKQLDVQLLSPKLSFSKDSSNPRAELCCKDSAGKRIYIWGSTEKQYGPKLKEHAELLRDFIASKPNISKKDALEYRDALKAQL